MTEQLCLSILLNLPAQTRQILNRDLLLGGPAQTSKTEKYLFWWSELLVESNCTEYSGTLTFIAILFAMFNITQLIGNGLYLWTYFKHRSLQRQRHYLIRTSYSIIDLLSARVLKLFVILRFFFNFESFDFFFLILRSKKYISKFLHRNFRNFKIYTCIEFKVFRFYWNFDRFLQNFVFSRFGNCSVFFHKK